MTRDGRGRRRPAWRRVGRLGLVAVVAAGVALGAMPPAAASGAPALRAARAPLNTAGDAAWILTAQLADGALATYPDRTFIDPYISNLAAIGLARARALTGETRFTDGVWRWLDWRCDRSVGRGFTDDHRIVDGVPVSTGDVNAIDSEAASFLLAVHEWWRATSDTAALGRLAACIGEAVGAMAALQDVDGLTWAKPTWKVKYLMNQAEVHAGLRSAATLARALGDLALATRATEMDARLTAAVAPLWNVATGGYDWAVHANGARIPVDWRILYPDALEQVWAAAFRLSDGQRGRDLMTRFGEYHPAWAQPAAIDLMEGAPGPVGYWPIAGWGLLAVGRREEARSAAASIRAGADAARWAWPLDVAGVGALIVLDGGRLPAGLS